MHKLAQRDQTAGEPAPLGSSLTGLGRAPGLRAGSDGSLLLSQTPLPEERSSSQFLEAHLMLSPSANITSHVFRLRPVHRRRARHCGAPNRPRPAVKALQDRCLPSGYSITEIGAIVPYPPASDPLPPQSAINNAAVVQVVGEGNGLAYLWESAQGMQELGTVGKDQSSRAFGVNNAGQVSGSSWSTATKYDKKTGESYTVTTEQAFVWSSSTGMQGIGKSVVPSGINGSGEISGVTFGAPPVAELWNGKTWTQLGVLPGGTFSDAFGINNYGQVVGYGDIPNTPTSAGLYHAFLWTPSSLHGTAGTMIDLGTLSSTVGGSWASAINGQGWVTGRSDDASAGGAGHAYVWEPSSAHGTTGRMIDLGTLAVNPNPGLSQSEGNAINDRGVVVGDANPAGVTSQSQVVAVVWQPGTNGSYTVSDLNNLIPSGTGWTLIRADAVNNSGQIVVEATNASLSGWYALLLTPSTTAAPARPAAGAASSSLPGGAVALPAQGANGFGRLPAVSWRAAARSGAGEGPERSSRATDVTGFRNPSGRQHAETDAAGWAVRSPFIAADVVDGLFADLEADSFPHA
jgi:probable HAF family extracellular repeat protein